MQATKYFISYSRKDANVVVPLVKDLRSVGVNLWIDQLDIPTGQRWDNSISEALAECDGMIIFLSPESVSSENVLDEISYGIEEQKIIISALIKNCKIPYRLRRIQYVDFTEEYRTAYSEILNLLNVSPEITVDKTQSLGSRHSRLFNRLSRLHRLPFEKLNELLGEKLAAITVSIIRWCILGYFIIRIQPIILVPAELYVHIPDGGFEIPFVLDYSIYESRLIIMVGVITGLLTRMNERDNRFAFASILISCTLFSLFRYLPRNQNPFIYLVSEGVYLAWIFGTPIIGFLVSKAIGAWSIYGKTISRLFR